MLKNWFVYDSRWMLPSYCFLFWVEKGSWVDFKLTRACLFDFMCVCYSLLFHMQRNDDYRIDFWSSLKEYNKSEESKQKRDVLESKI